MGLLRRGIKHDRLPRFSGGHYWTLETLGRHLGEWADARTRKAVHQLKQLPGTQSADLNDVIRADRTILAATRELDKLDEALQRASHMELQPQLFGSKLFESRLPEPSNPARRFNSAAAEEYEEIHRKMLAWASTVPEPQDQQARTMIERRRGLVLNLFAMAESFDETTRSISQSFRQWSTARSIERLDGSLGFPRLPLEHELEKVHSASSVAEVAAAGVDAIHPAAAPELSELAATAQPTAAGGSPSPELD